MASKNEIDFDRNRVNERNTNECTKYHISP